MILVKDDIRQDVEKGAITIAPFNPGQLNPNSYDLRLAPYVVCYARPRRKWYDPRTWFKSHALDAAKVNPTVEFQIPAEGLMLYPGQLYLMATEEFTYTPHHIPLVEGRSSVGRLGIHVHVSAGFGDIGFQGHWTLEIEVVEPVRVYAGMRICQIYFEIPSSPSGDNKYAGKYNGQQTPRPSLIWKETHEWERTSPTHPVSRTS